MIVINRYMNKQNLNLKLYLKYLRLSFKVTLENSKEMLAELLRHHLEEQDRLDLGGASEGARDFPHDLTGAT